MRYGINLVNNLKPFSIEWDGINTNYIILILPRRKEILELFVLIFLNCDKSQVQSGDVYYVCIKDSIKTIFCNTSSFTPRIAALLMFL